MRGQNYVHDGGKDVERPTDGGANGDDVGGGVVAEEIYACVVDPSEWAFSKSPVSGIFEQNDPKCGEWNEGAQWECRSENVM